MVCPKKIKCCCEKKRQPLVATQPIHLPVQRFWFSSSRGSRVIANNGKLESFFLVVIIFRFTSSPLSQQRAPELAAKLVESQTWPEALYPRIWWVHRRKGASPNGRISTNVMFLLTQDCCILELRYPNDIWNYKATNTWGLVQIYKMNILKS